MHQLVIDLYAIPFYTESKKSRTALPNTTGEIIVMSRPKQSKRPPLYLEEEARLEAEILNGAFGPSGEAFLSTRELARRQGVSLVTAQHILVVLRDKRLIELQGKKYYLTYSRIGKDTPLGQKNATNSHILGIHVTNIESPFFASLVKHAQKYAWESGYRLLVASSSYHTDQEREILNLFRDAGAVGVLSSPGVAPETTNLYDHYPLPHVFLGRKPENASGEAVLVNNAAAARRVAAHFLRENYAQFAYIGLTELDRAQDPRFTGFCEGLSRQGHRLPSNHVLQIDPEDADAANSAIEKLLQDLPKPVAVFCFHDLIATMVLQACQRLKLPCPKAIAVCGFDDLPVSAITDPPLTTVSYRISEMAETAIRLITRQIETGAEADTNYYLEPSLIVRESSSKKAVIQFQSYHTRDILYKALE